MSTTDEPSGGRRQSAVLLAEMVDHAKVTARSEALARRCMSIVLEAFDDAVPRHHGVFRPRPKGSVLALFATATEAVRAAIDVQTELERVRQRSPQLPAWIRVGVHVGEIVGEGDDVGGAGIETAERIQDEAPSGGIVISGDVHREIRDTLELEYIDLGYHELRDVGPVRLRQVVFGTTQVQPGERAEPVEWWQAVMLYRRELGVAAAGAVVAAIVGRRIAGPRRIVDSGGKSKPSSDVESNKPTSLTPKPDEQPAVPSLEEWPMDIGIMQIKAAGETPQWMSDITLQGLNALLSKFDKLRVTSQEVIDWKREKTGMTPYEIARDLNLKMMMNGELVRTGVAVHLQVHVVDTKTGRHVRTCEARGTEDKLVEVQNDVAVQLLQVLQVPVTKAEVDKAVLARTNVDLDVTKRFADAFPGMEDAPAPAPKEGPQSLRWSWPSDAWGAENDEAGVKELLERYRAALEAKNLDQLAAIYVTLSDPTRDALARYFQSANGLKVQFSAVSVLFEGDEALATFTRSDKFTDVQTGRDVNLEVRVSTVVAKAAGSWKIKALRKPS